MFMVKMRENEHKCAESIKRKMYRNEASHICESVFDQYLLVYKYVPSFDTPIDHEEPIQIRSCSVHS